MADRKLAAVHTVRTVASTPTRATLATSRSSSPRPTRRLNVRRTRMPSQPLLSPASTGGKLLADGSRLPEHEILCMLRGVMEGLRGGTRYVDCSRRRATVVISMCMHYAMLPTQARLAPHFVFIRYELINSSRLSLEVKERWIVGFPLARKSIPRHRHKSIHGLLIASPETHVTTSFNLVDRG